MKICAVLTEGRIKIIPQRLLQNSLDSLLFGLEQDKENSKFQSDPIEWMRSAFGEEYVTSLPKLQRAMRDILDNKQNLIYGSNSSGKTFSIAGCFSLWWIYGRGIKDAQVMFVSGGAQQTENIFKYVSQLIERNQERFLTGMTSINIDGKVVNQYALRRNGINLMYGRNPRQGTNNKQTLLGGHSLGGTLVICEEADGLSDTMMNGARRNTLSERDRWVCLSNPNDPDSYIGKRAKPYEDMLDGKEYAPNGWHVTQIGWCDYPTNPNSDCYNKLIPITQKEGLLSEERVNDYIRDFGTDSPEYNMYVLGRFDYLNKLSMITQRDINDGIATTADIKAELVSRPIIGCDLALFGENSTVAYMRHDIPTMIMKHYTEDDHECTEECREEERIITRPRYLDRIDDRTTDQIQQAQWLAGLCAKYNVAEVRTDATGLGAAFTRTLYDELERLGMDTLVIGLVASNRKLSGNQYVNDRAYWWGQNKTLLQTGYIDLDEDDERLIKELKSVGYSHDNTNKILLQSKRELSVSPDYADAYILACLPVEDIEYLKNDGKKQLEKVVAMEDVDPDFGRDTFYNNLGIDDLDFDELDTELGFL